MDGYFATRQCQETKCKHYKKRDRDSNFNFEIFKMVQLEKPEHHDELSGNDYRTIAKSVLLLMLQ